jgi:Fur family ferric uptake transcriptional regulator
LKGVISCDSIASGFAKLEPENEAARRREFEPRENQELPMKAPSLIRRSLMEELSTLGVRMTAQRRMIIEIIQGAAEHLDAATLLKLARKRDSAIDRATVYRTIQLLKKLRLIDELDLMHLEGEKHFYEVKTNRDHLHLACFNCGAIIEYTSAAFEKLKNEIGRESGFEIGVIRLEAGGRCKKCREVKAGD